jgi:hypothetical protein
MPSLRKVEESPSRIRYAHAHATGWVTAALGLVGLWYALTGLEGGARLGLLVLGGIFTAGGFSSAVSRFELTFSTSTGGASAGRKARCSAQRRVKRLSMPWNASS